LPIDASSFFWHIWVNILVKLQPARIFYTYPQKYDYILPHSVLELVCFRSSVFSFTISLSTLCVSKIRTKLWSTLEGLVYHPRPHATSKVYLFTYVCSRVSLLISHCRARISAAAQPLFALIAPGRVHEGRQVSRESLPARHIPQLFATLNFSSRAYVWPSCTWTHNCFTAVEQKVRAHFTQLEPAQQH
jgi:hypothetical protein